MGNEMRTANDGVEAVTDAERFRPEVILMDVKPVDLANLQWMGGGRTDRDRQNCATGAQKRRPFPARTSRGAVRPAPLPASESCLSIPSRREWSNRP